LNTKIYLNEWFINAGIIGFLKILEYNEQDFVIKKENYIEFDTSNLKDFHKYYFKYFFDQYNIAEKMTNRIENSFSKIANWLQDKEKKELLKKEQKHIKDAIKKELDKIKKIDEETYKIMFEDYSKIDKVQTVEELEEIQSKLSECFYKENINKKITLNLFKNILSKTYFGQPSFFNVIKNSLSYEEQQNLMYKDYISNIIEADVLQGIANEKYAFQELKEIIEQKLSDDMITKETKSIYENINKKFIQKEKTISEIMKYVKDTYNQTCLICGNDHFLTSDYTEGNFVPLAVSSDNMSNFFWNQNTNTPICDICKLILFCIPAGVTRIIKTEKENDTYKEKEILSFVNYDTDVETLVRTINSFRMQSKKERNGYNPYTDLILNIVEQDKKISEWQLQNIFVVEFEAEYLAFSRMEYFNIKRYVAKFFIKYSDILMKIPDYKYRIQIVEYILKNKDIRNIISERLREELKNKEGKGFASYLATSIKVTLEALKMEGDNMEEEVKKANNKVHLMFALGRDIKQQLKQDNNENKLDGYIYKMLNCIKTNNKNEFTDIIIRTLWSMGKDVPEILVRNNDDIEWQELGHSFIAGLTSKYEKKEEVV